MKRTYNIVNPWMLPPSFIFNLLDKPRLNHTMFALVRRASVSTHCKYMIKQILTLENMKYNIQSFIYKMGCVIIAWTQHK